MCGQKLKVEKPAETGDKYPKTYIQYYDPDIEHEKKSRLSKQRQLKRQEKVLKYLEATRQEGARQNMALWACDGYFWRHQERRRKGRIETWR